MYGIDKKETERIVREVQEIKKKMKKINRRSPATFRGGGTSSIYLLWMHHIHQILQP